jgi:hypothetical protein
MGDGFCKSKTNLIGFCLLKCIQEFKEYVNVWLDHLGIDCLARLCDVDGKPSNVLE